MKNLIPLFRIDRIINWKVSKEKVWKDAEDYYESLLKEIKGNLGHLVYLCSPLKSTEQKSVQDHIEEAIWGASQILEGVRRDNGRKIAVWIPHVHLFSIYNEIVYPEVREKAIKFNNKIIEKYFHTLILIGDKISGGMSAEIELARKNKIEVVKIEVFKKHLKGVPNLKRVKVYYRRITDFHNKVHGPKFLINTNFSSGH